MTSRGYPGDHLACWRPPVEVAQLALDLHTSTFHPLYHLRSKKARPCRRCGKEIAPPAGWWGTPAKPYCLDCHKVMRPAERLVPFTRHKATGVQVTEEELEANALQIAERLDAEQRAKWEQGSDGEWRRR